MPKAKRNKIIKSVVISLAAIAVCAAICLAVLNKPKPELPADVHSFAEVSSETSGSSKEPAIKKLAVASPKQTSVTTTEPEFEFSGGSDPSEPLYINNVEINRAQDGSFAETYTLKAGKNTFVIKHKDTEKTYTVTYKYTVIKSCTPSTTQKLSGGSTVTATVKARSNSKVTAAFNGKTISLKKVTEQADDDAAQETSSTFVSFSGTFTLPKGGLADKNLGSILFTATSNGVTEKKSSASITLKKSTDIKASDPSVTPKGGSYMDVGSGLIATIVCESAETFTGNTTDDYSRPTNNYLPKGTVDYCAEATLAANNTEYYKLRCGRRIYKTNYAGKSYETTVATVSTGTLPDHNEIGIYSFKNEGQYQILKLNTLFKAPFYFDILNQSYTDPALQKYTMSSVTFSYIDITLCYTTKLTGELNLPENNPLFSKAEIIKNKNDYTLRLHLKRVGGFYGWYAFYDESGRLTFKFLNPAVMENENSLKGIRIFVDVGHGGSEIGAGGYYKNKDWEALTNLTLAKKVKAELEKLGATVIISRTSNVTVTPPDKMSMLRAADAHFCISIHHDSNTKKTMNGFGSYHFSPFAKTAAEFIDDRMDNTGIYRTDYNVKFHYYFEARVSNCPVVLTENGFMSNKEDYEDILDDSKNSIKAKALVQGILDYFRSIQ